MAYFKTIGIKFQCLLCIFLWTAVGKGQEQNSFKFDFGCGPTAKGYTKVQPDAKFSYKVGFGFDQGATLSCIDRHTKDPLTSDFITSKNPFFFSVVLPDGNYEVSVVLGDPKGTSATTVRAECRRLFLQNVKTTPGQIVTKYFNVHVKDSLIKNSDGKTMASVKIKPREYTYLHWDNRLTLEFNDSLIKVCAIEIKPATKATTVFLAGNSTVVDQDREPWAAWGQMFPSFFEPHNGCVANYAESGETLKAFEKENRLMKIWSLCKPGDYLFIEFTHNDQKPGANHLDPYTSYKDTLKSWMKQARSRQVIPVLVTSMHRRNFDSTGHINNTLLEYPNAMRQVAAEENVYLIDLNAMSKTLYEAWGVEKSMKAFVHFPANTFPGQTTELKDNTHFTPYGAYELARCVVKAIQTSNPALATFLNKQIPSFDPSQPDAIQAWYWPIAPLTEAVKPDGN